MTGSLEDNTRIARQVQNDFGAMGSNSRIARIAFEDAFFNEMFGVRDTSQTGNVFNVDLNTGNIAVAAEGEAPQITGSIEGSPVLNSANQAGVTIATQGSSRRNSDNRFPDLPTTTGQDAGATRSSSGSNRRYGGSRFGTSGGSSRGGSSTIGGQMNRSMSMFDRNDDGIVDDEEALYYIKNPGARLRRTFFDLFLVNPNAQAMTALFDAADLNGDFELSDFEVVEGKLALNRGEFDISMAAAEKVLNLNQNYDSIKAIVEQVDANSNGVISDLETLDGIVATRNGVLDGNDPNVGYTVSRNRNFNNLLSWVSNGNAFNGEVTNEMALTVLMALRSGNYDNSIADIAVSLRNNANVDALDASLDFFDPDGDGSISFQEFANAYLTMRRGAEDPNKHTFVMNVLEANPQLAEVHDAIQTVDFDANGLVSDEEVINLFLRAFRGEVTADPAAVEAVIGFNNRANEIGNLVVQIDENQDGTISDEEVLQAISELRQGGISEQSADLFGKILSKNPGSIQILDLIGMIDGDNDGFISDPELVLGIIADRVGAFDQYDQNYVDVILQSNQNYSNAQDVFDLLDPDGNGQAADLDLFIQALEFDRGGSLSEQVYTALFYEAVDQMDINGNVMSALEAFDPNADGVIENREYTAALMAFFGGQVATSTELVQAAGTLGQDFEIIRDAIAAFDQNLSGQVEAQEFVDNFRAAVSENGEVSPHRLDVVSSVVDLIYPDAALLEQFKNQLDENSDNIISDDELINGVLKARRGEITHPGDDIIAAVYSLSDNGTRILTLVDEVDLDRDGNLSGVEIADMVMRLSRGEFSSEDSAVLNNIIDVSPEAALARSLVNMADPDGNGIISDDEAINALLSMDRENFSDADRAIVVAALNDSTSFDAVSALVNSIDRNSDGFVSDKDVFEALKTYKFFDAENTSFAPGTQDIVDKILAKNTETQSLTDDFSRLYAESANTRPGTLGVSYERFMNTLLEVEAGERTEGGFEKLVIAAGDSILPYLSQRPTEYSGALIDLKNHVDVDVVEANYGAGAALTFDPEIEAQMDSLIAQLHTIVNGLLADNQAPYNQIEDLIANYHAFSDSIQGVELNLLSQAFFADFSAALEQVANYVDKNHLDINNDGRVTPNDILRIVNHVNGPNSQDYVRKYDVNFDGVVNGDDVNTIIDYTNEMGEQDINLNFTSVYDQMRTFILDTDLDSDGSFSNAEVVAALLRVDAGSVALAENHVTNLLLTNPNYQMITPLYNNINSNGNGTIEDSEVFFALNYKFDFEGDETTINQEAIAVIDDILSHNPNTGALTDSYRDLFLEADAAKPNQAASYEWFMNRLSEVHFGEDTSGVYDDLTAASVPELERYLSGRTAHYISFSDNMKNSIDQAATTLDFTNSDALNMDPAIENQLRSMMDLINDIKDDLVSKKNSAFNKLEDFEVEYDELMAMVQGQPLNLIAKAFFTDMSVAFDKIADYIEYGASDTNQDGRVTGIDAARVNNHINSGSTDYIASYDVDKDGDIDLDDFQAVTDTLNIRGENIVDINQESVYDEMRSLIETLDLDANGNFSDFEVASALLKVASGTVTVSKQQVLDDLLGTNANYEVISEIIPRVDIDNDGVISDAEVADALLKFKDEGLSPEFQATGEDNLNPPQMQALNTILSTNSALAGLEAAYGALIDDNAGDLHRMYNDLIEMNSGEKAHGTSAALITPLQDNLTVWIDQRDQITSDKLGNQIIVAAANDFNNRPTSTDESLLRASAEIDVLTDQIANTISGQSLSDLELQLIEVKRNAMKMLGMSDDQIAQAKDFMLDIQSIATGLRNGQHVPYNDIEDLMDEYLAFSATLPDNILGILSKTFYGDFITGVNFIRATMLDQSVSDIRAADGITYNPVGGEADAYIQSQFGRYDTLQSDLNDFIAVLRAGDYTEELKARRAELSRDYNLLLQRYDALKVDTDWLMGHPDMPAELAETKSILSDLLVSAVLNGVAPPDVLDVGGDGLVTTNDTLRLINFVGNNNGTREGDPNYNVMYDTNRDGVIDEKDVDFVIDYLNREGTGYFL